MYSLAQDIDAHAIMQLRLDSLKSDPNSFASDYEYESQFPLDRFTNRIMTAYKPPLFGYWKITKDSKIVGYTQLIRENLPRMNHIANVYELYVAPEYRNHGLASGLLKHLISLNTQLKIVEQFRLKVIGSNNQAIDLYQKLGFKNVATIPKSFKSDGQYQDKIVYVYDFEADIDSTR